MTIDLTKLANIVEEGTGSLPFKFPTAAIVVMRGANEHGQNVIAVRTETNGDQIIQLGMIVAAEDWIRNEYVKNWEEEEGDEK